MLQLFIVFKRSDREPSIIQMSTLISSFISMSNARIEGRFTSSPGTSWHTKVILVLPMLPVNFYLYVSLALLITTIQWNMIFFLTFVTFD